MREAKVARSATHS